MSIKNKKAFTLIEILVAIAIIGILATVLLANLQGIRSRARDSQRKRDLNEIRTALRLFYNDYQSYPVASSNQLTCEPTGSGTAISWGGSFSCSGTTYMAELPEDPLTGNEAYYYSRSTDGDSFDLCACLENLADPDSVDCATNCGTYSCSTGACYKVSGG